MVIGIVILLVVGVAGIMVFDLRAPLSTSATSGKTFVNQCFTATAECMLYRIGANSGALGFSESVPELDVIRQNSESYFSSAARECFGGFTQLSAQGQDVHFTRLTPDVLLRDRVQVTAENDIQVKEGTLTTTVGAFRETFAIPFAEIYAEALRIKHQQPPAGVPASYLKLDSTFDVSVAAKNNRKLIAVAGGELKKQYFRFMVVKT